MLIEVLVAVRREQASVYFKNLSAYHDFRVQVVTDRAAAVAVLADATTRMDVLVLDKGLDETAQAWVNELREKYPRLFVVLVDEEADFAMPGLADDISTEPFKDFDLIKRIARLMSDRQLTTLRADSLPGIRSFAKDLRRAVGEYGKQEVTVKACKALGFDYAALYRIDPTAPQRMTLKWQEGESALLAGMPKTTTPNDIMMWVSLKGQSRIVGASDTPNHLQVTRGKLGAVACVPLTTGGQRYGVLVVANVQADSIKASNVVLLELMATQFGAAMLKENIT